MSRHLRKIIGLLAILHAAPALAGLDLTWNACNLSTIPGADDVTLDCSNPVSVASLFGNFQVPQSVPRSLILEGFIDVDVDATELPPFWHYEDINGCNNSGLNLNPKMPAGPCPPSQNVAPWGSNVYGGVYATRVAGIPNRIRWNFNVRGPERGWKDLRPGTNYFAFQIDVLSDRAGTCEGCGAGARLVWTQADIYGLDSGFSLTGPGLRGNIVTVNHSYPLLVLFGIHPQRVPPATSATLTVDGRDIASGATAKLIRDGAEIAGDSLVTSADGRTLSGRFDVTGPAPSLWNVVVENPNGQRDSLPNAFEIRENFSLTSVTPNRGSMWGAVDVTIGGSELRADTWVLLHRSFAYYIKQIPATNLVFAPDGHSATARFSFYLYGMDPSIDPGLWSVMAGSPTGSADTLVDAFELVTEPHVVALDPNVVTDTGQVVLSIHGSGFVPGALATLGRDGDLSIAGIGPVVNEDGTILTATFDVLRRGGGNGNWTVGMQNPDGFNSYLYAALRIIPIPGPTLTLVDPNRALNHGVTYVHLRGKGFAPDARVVLRRASFGDIPGVVTAASSDSSDLTVAFDLTEQIGGLWDVVVKNPTENSARLSSAFEVISSPPQCPGGLDLTWSACNRPSGVGSDDFRFTCVYPENVAEVMGNFQPPVTIDGLMGMEAELEIVFAQEVPPFWRLDPTGCNANGIAISVASPLAVCPTAQNPNAWGPLGSAAVPFVTALVIDPGQPNRARLHLSIVRTSPSPTTLQCGQNYYAFHLLIPTEHSGDCDGCAEPARIEWTSATFYSATPSLPPITVVSAGIRSKSVTLNGGLSEPSLMTVTPRQSMRGSPLEIDVTGRHLEPGMSVRLSRILQSDIVASVTNVAADGGSLIASLNTGGALPGSWDVVVNRSAGDPLSLLSQLEILDSTTPIRLVSRFEAQLRGEAVELSWTVSEPGKIDAVVVERAEQAGGPWTELKLDTRTEGMTTFALDSDIAPASALQYRLEVRGRDGSVAQFGPIQVMVEPRTWPFALKSVAPNPSNAPVAIEYSVPRPVHVRLVVSDVLGREVKRLEDGPVSEGNHRVIWDGRASRGLAPAGLYFVRLETGRERATRRFALTR